MTSQQPRTMLVLGATSAIAQATACLFARDGMRMLLIARDQARLESVAGSVRENGACEVFTHVADLTQFDLHGEIVNQAIVQLGQIDIVLFAHGYLGPVTDEMIDYPQAQKILNVNLLSVISLMTFLEPVLCGHKGGQVIVISSIAGERGKMRNHIYATAKGALNLYLAGLRNRLYFHGVHVMTVLPGQTDTPMTREMPKSRFIVQPEVIARGIHRASRRRRDIVYLPAKWRWIMLIVRLIPERWFKRMRM